MFAKRFFYVCEGLFLLALSLSPLAVARCVFRSIVNTWIGIVNT